jgi:hypothetical protein
MVCPNWHEAEAAEGGAGADEDGAEAAGGKEEEGGEGGGGGGGGGALEYLSLWLLDQPTGEAQALCLRPPTVRPLVHLTARF